MMGMEMTFFIAATSYPNAGLISLVEARWALRQIPFALLTGIAEEEVKKHVRSGDPVARRYAMVMRKDFEAAAVVDDLVDRILFHAVASRELQVFIGRGHADRVNLVKSFIWMHGGGTVDVHEAIQSGVLKFKHDLSARPIELEVNNRELLIDQKEFEALLRNKNVGEETARRAGVAIREAHLGKYGVPGKEMRREEFLLAMQSALSGCKKRQALRVWAEVAPLSWRARGRRKQSA